MRLHKLAAVLLLGSVSLWAQNATKPADSKDRKAPAAATAQKKDAAKEHKCACEHAKDAKKECHCKEMMAAKEGEECKGHGKDANMSKMSDHKMIADKGCCGCCGGKCDRMKHKMDHDKGAAPKSGM